MTHFQRWFFLTTDFRAAGFGTTEYTEYTEASSDNPFVLNQRIMTEVDQQADPKPCRSQIVVHLSSMFIRELRHRLDLQNDFIKTEKVWLVDLSEFTPFILQPKN